MLYLRAFLFSVIVPGAVGLWIPGELHGWRVSEAWWASLTPAEQANPANRARYEATKAALERAGGFLESADQAVGNAGEATVQYSLDKRPEDMWNFMVGAQYQLSKNWMFRLELGGLTSRTHIIAGAQYRFGL